MLKKIVRVLLMVFACYMVLKMTSYNKDKDTANFLSDVNMKSSIAEIQEYLVDEYSASNLNNYKGKAKVSTTYSSNGILVDNMSQSSLNDQWNKAHPDKKIDGSCGYVAITMMINKYMNLVTNDKMKNKESKISIFNKLVNYGFNNGWISKKMKTSSNLDAGTGSDEQVKMSNYYIDTFQNDVVTANKDTTFLWSTTKKYMNKIRPVKLGLTGKKNNEKHGHAVIATACYTEKVTYTEKNIFGNWTKKNVEYNVCRICDGWSNSVNSNWNATTNKYIFYECVVDLVKFK